MFIHNIKNLVIPGIKYGFVSNNIPGMTYKFIIRSESKNNPSHTEINNNHKLLSQHVNGEFSFVDQIHSSNVVFISNKNELDPVRADAQITSTDNLNLCVMTADCCPILIYCPKSNQIAAIHAGWRGAYGGIIQNTIAKLADIQGAIAIIGPTIRQESYEVSEEFYNNFINQSAENAKYFIAQNSRYLFDLPAYVKAILESSGIDKIYDCGENTYTQPDKWFSFRRFTHNPADRYGSIISFIRFEK